MTQAEFERATAEVARSVLYTIASTIAEGNVSKDKFYVRIALLMQELAALPDATLSKALNDAEDQAQLIEHLTKQLGF